MITTEPSPPPPAARETGEDARSEIETERGEPTEAEDRPAPCNAAARRTIAGIAAAPLPARPKVIKRPEGLNAENVDRFD